MLHRDELTSKRYTINTRLKLFESVVTTTLLYGCASWTVTRSLETRLKTTQRKMPQMIIGAGRRRARPVVNQQHYTTAGNTEHETSQDDAGDDVDSNKDEPTLDNQLQTIHENEEDHLEPWVD